MHRRSADGRRHHKTDSMSQNHCCRYSLSVCRLVSTRRSSYRHLPILLLDNPFGNPKDRMTDKSSYLADPYFLPLESICVYVGQGKEKILRIYTGERIRIRFHGHHKLAMEIFSKRQILLPSAFVQVDWTNVNKALHEVPRLFQLWACKQVNDIAGTNSRLNKCDGTHSPLCPSCLTAKETCAHVLMCEEADRVKCSRCQRTISTPGYAQ